jgi:hypothetical protein
VEVEALCGTDQLALWLQQRHSEAGSWREMSLNLADVASLSYYVGILTCRKLLKHGDGGFASPTKEGVLRIVITLKNSSPSAGFKNSEPCVQWQAR